MRRIAWCAVALLAACGGGDAGEAEPAPGGVEPAAVSAAPDSAETPMGQDVGGATGLHVGLNPVGGATASGMAMTAQEGEEISIELTVTGGPASESLPAHLHRGRCGSDQGVAAPLDPVNTAEGGGGTATSRVAASLLRDGEHFVQVHGPDGAPILCGDLPIEGS